MSASVITWSQDTSNLGKATAAIGVFDGVHLGHQALLRDTLADARRRGVRAVAVTFDRDPDQVVSAASAAPQLLTLGDKLACIAETGVDVIVVVPFTPMLAEMAPESFVDTVLLTTMRPEAVHVGKDFRFGTHASGDVAALERFGLARGFEVAAHDLIEFDGAPITSTRIRGLVAQGDIRAARSLLCRAPRVAGSVRRGRGEGTTLGFPTANVVPVPFAALPANGVYAGRAVLEDGIQWAAAISVGTPPTFPEARDYLEAHLVDFEGDLYGQTITLEFFDRLRDQRAFDSAADLTEAIADDVAAALEIAGFDEEEDEEAPMTDDFVDDPDALAQAEELVANIDPDERFEQIEDGWTPLLTGVEICEGPGAVPIAFSITSPLEAAGIPCVWDPVTPGSIVSAARGPYPGRFTLYVPQADLADAQRALADAGSSYALAGTTRKPDAAEDAPAIEDPEALDAAERAVRHAPLASAPEPNDEMVVLLDQLPFDASRLSSLEAALTAAGVQAVWHPYPPVEAPLLKRALLGENRFRVEVWNSQLEIARDALQAAGSPD